MNIYALCTVSSAVDILNSLKSKINISGVVGLSKRDSGDSISGYVYFSKYCKSNNIKFFPVNSYSLDGPQDVKKLKSIKIDLLLVIGWQRLIPEWLIKQCKVAAIGIHGSANGISQGRGRSPQNWALILGMKKFYISLFQIDQGADSGAVIDTKSFELSDFDDIKTSYYKTGFLVADMIVDFVKNTSYFNCFAKAQSDNAKYLPKRTPEDGEIDWTRKTTEIYNFVRGLTKPYPGAFSVTKDFRIIIWKARPFGLEGGSQKEGKVVKIFFNGDILIKTKDGFLLIEDYTIKPDRKRHLLKESLLLNSGDFKKQMKTIVNRHYKKFPNLQLSDDILRKTR